MTKCYEEFKSQFLNYKRSKDEEIYILWFSFGAFLSLIASTELEIDGQFLCSISPFFKEDLPWTKKSWLNYLGKNRVKDLETVSFEKLATKIDCKTIIFYWDQEWPEVEKRALEAGEKIKNNTLIKIIWAQHDIWQKEYIEALEKNITS